MFCCALVVNVVLQSKRHQMRKFLRSNVSFCDNTVGHSLEHIGIEPLEEELTRAPKQLKRNKAFRDTIGGLHIVALDGTEFYRSTSIHCNECLGYQVQTKDGIVTHYVHRVVVAQKVGTHIKPVLACEKILPKDSRQKGDKTAGHEGELTAAKRLVDKVIFHFCGQNKDGTLRYEIYEISNIHQSLGWSTPLHGFLVIERKRYVKNGQIEWDETSFLCATTLKKWQASADVVRKIVHAEWGIENNGFWDLKNNWYMTHNYHHHPIATFAALLILFLAYNLFYAYAFLHMKTRRLYSLTIEEVVLEFSLSFWNQRNWLSLDAFG